jgi:hypothetical protein
LCLTIRQLRGLNQTLKLTALSGLLQLEADWFARKSRVDDILAERAFERAESEASAEARQANAAWAESLRIRERTAKENWFNGLDRLCMVIRVGHWSGIDWRVEYEAYLTDVMESHKDWFKPELYPHILALYSDWKARKN